jgi:hypothetical protein
MEKVAERCLDRLFGAMSLWGVALYEAVAVEAAVAVGQLPLPLGSCRCRWAVAVAVAVAFRVPVERAVPAVPGAGKGAASV